MWSPWDVYIALAALLLRAVVAMVLVVVLAALGFVAWCAAKDLVYGMGRGSGGRGRPLDPGGTGARAD